MAIDTAREWEVWCGNDPAEEPRFSPSNDLKTIGSITLVSAYGELPCVVKANRFRAYLFSQSDGRRVYLGDGLYGRDIAPTMSAVRARLAESSWFKELC